MMMSKPNHQYQQQQPQKIASSGDTHKNFTFLPLLCASSSTKQVKASHRRCASSSSAASSTVSDDPSSPKVGCMGQVKRNNKVIGFPNIISFTSSSYSSNNSIIGTHHHHHHHHHHVIKCHEPNNYTSNNIIKYYKLKRFFSTKSPTSVIPASKTARAGSHKGKVGRKNVGNDIVSRSKGNEDNKRCKKKSDQVSNDKGSLVNLDDMDPPLPVVKKALLQKEQGNNDGDKMTTLWKRRSGGAPLQSLRLQVIHHNVISPLTANTV